MIGLTKSLGKELAKTGIRVNCVTPAAVRTAIFDQMSQQHIDFMLSKIPLGRFGSVDEIAALVCWLASEECSSRPARCSTCRADARRTERRAASETLLRPRTASTILPMCARFHQRVCGGRLGERKDAWMTVFTSPRSISGQTSRAQRLRDRDFALDTGSRAASSRSRSGASS